MLRSDCTLLAALLCFFRSFAVRASCDFAVDFASKKVVSVVAIFKIEVARDFYVTKQRISTSWGVCRLLGCSRRAPSAALQLPTVACIATRNQTFAPYLSLELSILLLTSIDRYASGRANRQGPAATRRSLQIATHVDCFRSTPNCNHKQQARLTSFSFVRVGNESRF